MKDSVGSNAIAATFVAPAVSLPGMLFAALLPAQKQPFYQYPYRPIQKRAIIVELLLSLEEVQGQITDSCQVLEQLKVSAYRWWRVGLRGMAQAYGCLYKGLNFVLSPVSFAELPVCNACSMHDSACCYLQKASLSSCGFGPGCECFASQQQAISAEKHGKGRSGQLEAPVTQAGRREAEEVVQLYSAVEIAGVGGVLYVLKSYKRLRTSPRERASAQLAISPGRQVLMPKEGAAGPEPVVSKVYAGGSLPDRRRQGLSIAKPLEAILNLK